MIFRGIFAPPARSTAIEKEASNQYLADFLRPGTGSGEQLLEGDAVNASNPARQVALIGEARVCRDFSQAGPSVANKLHRTLQSQMHDITVRRHSNGSAEHAGEVERAASR